MSLLHEKSFRIIAVASIVVTLLACGILIITAERKGLNPLHLTGDSRGYVILAENIRNHGVFSAATSEPYYPESFRSPGYPAFLALIFSAVGVSYVALFIHALLVSSAPILLYALLHIYHERAAFWAAFVFIFEPIRLFLSASFLSDAFFSVVFLAAILCLMRVSQWYKAAFLAGLLLGSAILVRPIAIFLPLLCAVYLLLAGESWKRGIVAASVLCVTSVVVVGPWMYRNHVLFDSWNVSSVGAANLMLYNAPEFLKWRSDEKAGALLASFQETQAALPRETSHSLARSSVFTDTFHDIIRGNELSYFFFHVVKTVPFFITDGLRDTIRLFNVDIGTMPNMSTALMRFDISLIIGYVFSGGLAVTLFLIGTSFWSTVTLLFMVETVRAIMGRIWLPTLFCAALVVYFALLTGPVSNARYRVPVEGFLLFSAFVVGFRWYDRRHEALER